jgi:arylsulfatase A-like enzyme
MTGRSGPSRPNIIIVLIDTLRADHLSCYGHARRTSPNIDALAARGRLWERSVSPAPWTPPSHASLFTGTYPSRHGVDRSHLILDPSLTPLPEVLKRHGYRTYGVSSNYWLSRETRFDRGFDEFAHSWQLVQTHGTNKPLQRQQLRQDLQLATVTGSSGVKTKLGDFVNEQFEKTRQRLRRSYHLCDDGARRVNSFVRGWLPRWRRDDEPFFAFLHYMEPHIRYAAPRQYHTMHVPDRVSAERVRRLNQDPWKYLTGRSPMDDEEFEILRGLYDGEVSYIDYQIGQLVGMLESAGLMDETAIFLTSDHGENLGEHGLMDHCYCLYDTLLRVPLIAHYPTAFGRGERSDRSVQTHDLFPTILELAGVRDDPAWSQVQSRSLLGENGADRIAFSEYLEPQPPLPVLRQRYPGFEGKEFDRALRTAQTNDLKYVWGSDGRDELYDLSADPHEAKNLIDERPEEARKLYSALETWLASFQHSAQDQDTVELDESTIKKLEQLGYLQ